MQDPSRIDRRDFLRAASAATSLTGVCVAAGSTAAGESRNPRKIKVGVIGCGSVSRHYFPDLLKSPNIEIVSTCDIRPDRAVASAKKFGIARHFPHIDEMLAFTDGRLAEWDAINHIIGWNT